MKYTVIGTIFSVVMLYITAYPLAQRELPGRKLLSIFFLITMYFGGGLVPTYLVVKQTGLVGSMINKLIAKCQQGYVGVSTWWYIEELMQNWSTSSAKPYHCRWFGQMSIPRELSLKNGRLCQLPVRELERYQGSCVVHRNIPISGEVNLPGVRGRLVDMTVTVKPIGHNSYSLSQVRSPGFSV